MKTHLPNSFIYLSTFRCNAKCTHCYFFRELNKDISELSISEIEKITDSLNPLREFSISGGEPFLRKDNPEICQAFSKLNPKECCIPTNGTLVKEIGRQVESILDTVDYRITLSVSLDGMKETHDRIRGIKVFNRVERTCKMITEMKESYSNLFLKIITTISNNNYEEVVELSDYVHEVLSPDFHGFEIVRGSPRDATVPPIKELKKLRPIILNTYKQYNHGYGYVRGRLVAGIKALLYDYYLDMLSGSGGIPCLAGNAIGVLYPDGDVRLCELTGSVGNVRDVNYDFKEVWFSERANKMRESFAGCSCTHTSFQIQNVKHDLRMMLKLPRYSFGLAK